MWNKGSISLETDSTIEEWNKIFSEDSVSISVVNSNKTTVTWFGFASFIGLRYYVRPWCAVDIKTGYLTNYYNRKKWKFQGKTFAGPVMNIDGLPIVTLKVIFGW